MALNVLGTRKDNLMNKNRYIFGDIETILILKNSQKVRVSTELIEKIWPYTWCIEGTGYVMSRTSGVAIKLHRLITGACSGEFVDHVDGDIKNNTISNLRICTKQQNEFNTKIRVDNSSGFKGVCYIEKLNKYRAYINYCGKQINLGLYLDKTQAAKAYNGKACELFGEYAKLNFVS